jgi:hypothetical protein
MTTKILGDQITNYTINTEQLSNTATAAFAKTLAPKILYANVASNTYSILDDTAVNVGGGYIVISGAEFQSGAQVLIDTSLASSVTYVNSTTLRAQIPSKSAASYNLYVVNPDGGVGIKVSGITYSGSPTWVTTSPLANVISNTVFSGTFSATGATSYANTSILPTGFNLLANGYYYGNISVGSATTYNFDIRATDAELQDSDKSFSLTTNLVNLYGDFGFSLEGGTLTNIGSGSNSMNNNGASVSTAQAAQGSYSLYFNGTASVDINSTDSSTWSFLSSSPVGTNTLGTIEFYIYPQTVGNRGVMVGSYRSTQEKGWTIDYDNGGNLFFARDSAGASTNGGSYSVGLSLNTWTKLGFVFRTDGSHQIEIYKNGTYHGTYNYGSNATFSETNMKIGRRADNALGTVGYIDDFKIWLGTRGPY